MEQTFKLNDLPNGEWSVGWPRSFVNDIIKLSDGKLLDFIFKEIKPELGFSLGIFLNSGELEPYWISNEAYWQKTPSWDWFAERYQVGGVIFRRYSEAAQFKELMDQKLTWYYLNANSRN